MPLAGPIGILVFGRGLQKRARSGFYLAVGSALAESVYAYLAFWGFSKLLAAHAWIQPISRGVAALILIALGLRFASSNPAPEVISYPPEASAGHKRSFLLGVTVAALNPTLIVTWSGAVTALHSFDLVAFDSSRALPFSLGVCCGISAWFAVLLTLLARYRRRFQRATLDRTLRVLGVLLTLLGLFFAARFAMYIRSVV
jgi:threonine/homoserine/homoserine lactone efflux protein